MPDPDWWEALWADPASVLATVGIGPGMNVVDVCCGDGWFTLRIAKFASHVTSIDIDQKLLDQSRLRLDDDGITNCEFVAGDAYDVAKLVPKRADFVFLANTFHGVSEQTRLSKAVSDTLVSGGQFAVVNWHQRPREETTILGQPRGPRTELRMSPQQTALVVTAAGLALERIVELPPYHCGAIFRRE